MNLSDASISRIFFIVGFIIGFYLAYMIYEYLSKNTIIVNM